MILCTRCHGLMIKDEYFDMQNGYPIESLRCLCCGALWDEVIAQNQAKPLRPDKKRRVWHRVDPHPAT